MRAKRMKFLSQSVIVSCSLQRRLAPEPPLLTVLQQRIDGDDQQQRSEEEHHAREAVQEALPGSVAIMEGDECEHHHADDVGGEGNRHDQDGQGDVAEERVAADQTEIKQAQCFEREQRVQAGAGVGHQHFVLTDLQDHAGARDRVANPEEHVFGDVGDGHFHWQGHCIDKRTGQRDHEEHEEEGEPLRLERFHATGEQQDGGEQPDQRADFEEQDVLRAANGVEQQAEDEERPAAGCGRLAFADLPHRWPLAPDQPTGDAEDDRAVFLLVGAPEAGEQVDQAGDVEDEQSCDNR